MSAGPRLGGARSWVRHESGRDVSGNVDIMRRRNPAFNRRDRNAAFADLRPDVEWRDLEHAPDTPSASMADLCDRLTRGFDNEMRSS